MKFSSRANERDFIRGENCVVSLQHPAECEDASHESSAVCWNEMNVVESGVKSLANVVVLVGEENVFCPESSSESSLCKPHKIPSLQTPTKNNFIDRFLCTTAGIKQQKVETCKNKNSISGTVH